MPYSITGEKKISKKYLIAVGAVIFAAFIFYAHNAARSGLWYDEAIEYYYSKFLTGHVPGGNDTANMYERILLTFQPPLYNILMYIWLAVFDSEFLFRLAGVLVTIIGSAGCFLAIEEILPDSKWGIVGTAFYLFNPIIRNYGLECAEYNLMMCFVAWAVYFYLRVLSRHDRRSLLGFFIFSSAAVYSQYGAAFIVAGMYLSIFVCFVYEKKNAELKQFALMSIVTLLVAVLPLILFFVVPQMKHQGSLTVSHAPYFEHGLIIDFFIGAVKTLMWMFDRPMIIPVLAMMVICCIAVILRPDKMAVPLLSALIVWILYYAAVSSSFYGYNYWNPESRGTMNLVGRYSTFAIPFLVTILIAGLGICADWLKEKNLKSGKCVTVIAILCVAFYCSYETYMIEKHYTIKDDVREAVSAWYELEGYKSRTLVYEWDDALFHFYLTHNDRYDKSFDDSVEIADLWLGNETYDEMEEELRGMGYLSLDEYYYITIDPETYPSYFDVSKSSEAVLSMITDAGYHIERVYDGMTLLLHVTK